MPDLIEKNKNTGVVPYLQVVNAADALNFYTKVFGATVVKKYERSSGYNTPPIIYHAEINIDGSCIMISDSRLNDNNEKIKNECGSITLSLNASDVDKLVFIARKYGARIIREPRDEFWGDRMASIIDPFGIKWGISKHVKDVSDKNIESMIDKKRQYEYRNNENSKKNRQIPQPPQSQYVSIYKFYDL